MDLFILRHAIAEDRTETSSGLDSQRRLTTEGEKKMRQIAEGMKACGLSFDLILSSPFLRARETAVIAAEALGLKKAVEFSSNLAAGGDSKKLIEELNSKYSKCHSILLVGHEPGLSRLISMLIAGDSGVSIQLKKGGLAKLSVGKLTHGQCASLEWLLTPRQLRCLGK